MKTYTESEVAKIIVHSMLECNINPDAEFTAAGGHDYGYVAAFSLPDEGGYIIQYGNNGQTDYAICDDADDLACWLDSPDLSGRDAAIQTANVRGADVVSEASCAETGPFYVLSTRYWYGLTETSDLARDERWEPIEFATHAEAQEWIYSALDGTYYLSHNESGRPTYKIIVG